MCLRRRSNLYVIFLSVYYSMAAGGNEVVTCSFILARD